MVREPEGWLDTNYVPCVGVLSILYVHFIWFVDSAVSQVMRGDLSPNGSIEIWGGRTAMSLSIIQSLGWMGGRSALPGTVGCV